ncbi:hypothetical protein BDW59DRAFT_4022 [Aspergillus cavernicola]|uniref:Calcium uniporter protein, mitochondrial n=1 Tax=Aspergillus cavernicola TaxID=176166 RepID=A0ABR4J525_9EURO
MELPSVARHAAVVARELRVNRGNCLHTRPLQFCNPGVPAGLRRTHGLSGCHVWRQGLRAETLKNGVTALETGRRYIQSSLDNGPHRQRISPKHKERMGIESGSQDQDGAAAETGENVKPRHDPVSRDSYGQNPQKGKLLTTPSRLLKLLIPLPTDHPTDIETIAILVHSQQPLSYLERLIQAELSSVKEGEHERRPGVSFIAFQYEDHPIRPRKVVNGTKSSVDPAKEMEVEEVAVADDKGQGHPEETKPPNEELNTYSSLRQAQPNHSDTEQRYVRWSHATEIGDFIRDAARAREFIVAIEGAPAGMDQIRIAVPSFDERTHFLRMRLRKISNRIRTIAEIKHECDQLAHRGAQRVALGGFGILASWWCLVYKLTFWTELGWDTMEPITYLVSLSTLMGGYLWFLYHNREISYRSALDFTINARQKKLYQLKGIDLQLWENLIYEGNSLRREIKTIAAEYDTEWDEKLDEQDESVTEALKDDRNQKKDNDEQSDDKKDKDD